MKKSTIELSQEQYSLLLELATLGEIVRTGDRLPSEKGEKQIGKKGSYCIIYVLKQKTLV